MDETLRLRPDGFRERGGEVTRIEAFVDAAFAFALTMLVISVGAIPDSIPKLLDALRDTPAFAACFGQIALIWYAHVTWSRRYGLDDTGSIALSLVLVFLLLVYIYPLKYMFGSLFSWISGGRLSPEVHLGSIENLRAMFVIYAIVFGTMAIVFGLLYRRAWMQREVLGLSLEERVRTVQQIVTWCVSAGVACVSIGVAFLLRPGWPDWLMGAPGMAYLLMSLNGPIPLWFARRARTRMQAEGIA
jgi:hypothetical protein